MLKAVNYIKENIVLNNKTFELLKEHLFMGNNDFYAVEKKSIDYLRSYVYHDEFLWLFNHDDYDGMHVFFHLSR